MPTQTAYQQRDIIASAARMGELDRLRWYIEVEFPKRMIPAGIRRRQPAQWPHGCIPVLPVGDDIEESRAWAEMRLIGGEARMTEKGRTKLKGPEDQARRPAKHSHPAAAAETPRASPTRKGFHYTNPSNVTRSFHHATGAASLHVTPGNSVHASPASSGRAGNVSAVPSAARPASVNPAHPASHAPR